jgi:hypothetical protein
MQTVSASKYCTSDKMSFWTSDGSGDEEQNLNSAYLALYKMQPAWRILCYCIHML